MAPQGRDMSAVDTLKVRVLPYRKMVGMGNILWLGKYPMRAGAFPKEHPVGGKFGPGSEFGDGPNILAFRARGYWASCFPEGDGISWQPIQDQSDEQCLCDIRECFGWETSWDSRVGLEDRG